MNKRGKFSRVYDAWIDGMDQHATKLRNLKSWVRAIAKQSRRQHTNQRLERLENQVDELYSDFERWYNQFSAILRWNFGSED